MAFTKINAAGIGTTERVTVDGLTVINNLSVGGTVSIAGTLTYEDVTNIDAVGLITARDGIFVSAGSSIGIGTAAPADILHLRSTDPILKVDATNNASGLRIDVLGQTGGTNNQLFRVQRDGTTKLQLNDDGDLVITGNDNSELKLKAGTAAGEDKVGFLNSDGDTKGNISYDTVNNSLAFKLGGVAASNEKVRIDSNGRVGLGVTDPDSRLTVAATNGTTQIELKRSNTNATGTVGALNFTASDGHSVANISAIGDGDNEGSHLVFRTTSAAGEHSPFGGSTIERLRITSSGDVGIGLTDPEKILHVHGNALIEDTIGNNLEIRSTVNNGNDPNFIFSKARGGGTPTIVQNNDDIGNFNWRGYDGNSYEIGASILGEVEGTPSDGDMPMRMTLRTRSAGAASPQGRLQLSADGNVKVITGNLVISTAGKGIDFSATADGGGTTSSELLDDYEEGSFTPTTGHGTFTDAVGKYTKIGNQVTVWIYVPTLSDTTTSSNFIVQNLPFSGAANMVQAVGSVMIRYIDSVSLDSGHFTSYQDSNWSYLRIYTSRDDGNNYEPVKHSDFTQVSPGLRICHSYQVA